MKKCKKNVQSLLLNHYNETYLVKEIKKKWSKQQSRLQLMKELQKTKI